MPNNNRRPPEQSDGLHGNSGSICFTEKRFFEWEQDKKSVSLRASSGSYGGGSEVLVIQKVYDGDRRHADYKDVGEVSPTVTAKYGTGGGNTPIVMQKVTGTLNPGGHPGSYNGQDAYNDLLVVDDGNCDGISAG